MVVIRNEDKARETSIHNTVFLYSIMGLCSASDDSPQGVQFCKIVGYCLLQANSFRRRHVQLTSCWGMQ